MTFNTFKCYLQNLYKIHCFISISTRFIYEYKFLYQREQIDFCTRHALFVNHIQSSPVYHHLCSCVILTSMCLPSTYDHFSPRALSKGGAFLKHNKENHHQNFFLQIFLFHSTLFLPILHYHFSWGNGEEIINCFFCDERFLCTAKGDPHQQRLILCYQLHAHHYHYLFVYCLQTNNTILFFFLFFVNMNKINRKKIE